MKYPCLVMDHDDTVVNSSATIQYPCNLEYLKLYRHGMNNVNEGGEICVVSHSLSAHILRDWKENGLPEPKLIFGWDDPPQLRKPNPYPLYCIMEQLGYHAGELLMVDDLKPGCDMAQTAGVDFVAAGWAYNFPSIERYMRQNCLHYAPTVEALSQFLWT